MQLNFFDLSLTELENFLYEKGHKKFHARQIYKWVYQKEIHDIQKMTDLSASLRDELAEYITFQLPQLVSHLKSQDGTQKFVFKTPEGFEFEAVMIPSDERYTLCLSSQVGCNLACKFCYTGKQKLKKRLTPSEIVGQYIIANQKISPQKITTLVFMGMGEPLDNELSVFSSIETFRNPLAFGLSRKRITVSTSGLVDKIPLVTRAQVRLAVSLNSSDNPTRDKIMPINRKWPLETLLKACKDHVRISKDKVTFEYVLLKGVTDSVEQARTLYNLTKDIPCMINLIPFNEHPNSGFSKPAESQIDMFQKTLIRLGAQAFRRKTRGDDILAACGQLNPKSQTLQEKNI